jgi:hypothetical protein
MKENQNYLPLSNFRGHGTASRRVAVLRRRCAYILWAALAFVAYGAASAQNPAPLAAQQPNSATSSAATKPNNQEDEQNGLLRLKAELRRNYSDETGRARPDLLLKAIDHLRSMKVASQIGPPKK